MSRFIGIDLHKNMFVACFYENKGKKEFKTYSMHEIKRFKKDLKKKDVVGVETTTNTKYFVQEIKELVREVKVINTRQFKVITSSVKKTDKNDAEIIAYYLSKGMIPQIRMKERKYSEVESLAHTRDRLVKLRTALKNKIHNILCGYGIVTKKETYSSKKNLKLVLEEPVSELAKIELKVIVQQIENLDKGIEELNEKLSEKGKELEGYENLISIKGIGEKSSAILLSCIGNIKDFESRKKLDAYFGMVPRISQSNEHTFYGKITKQGNKLARTTLVQCTLIAIKYSDYLKKFYLKLKSKKGSGKAIIATARKLLGIIYNTLVNNWIFEDFTQFIKKPAY